MFSNIYLSRLDDYVKRELKCRHYGRYVDDFFIVGNSRDELLQIIPRIRDFLSCELGLRLHPRKVHLVQAQKGVRFLGAIVKPHQRYICPRGATRARNHIFTALAEEPDLYRVASILQSYSGYSGHFSGNLLSIL